MRIVIVALVMLALGCAKSAENKRAGSEPPGNSSASSRDAAVAAGKDRPQNVTPGDRAPTRPATPLVWSTDEKAALARAKKERKPVLIDFGAEWCVPCEEYERKVFTDPAVIERLSEVILLRFDVTEQDETDEAIQERYKATTLPTLIGLSPDGAETVRITSYLEPEAFLRALARLE